MDEQTALIFALQLVALFSIAGALMLYLVCKIRGSSGSASLETSPGAGKPILVTCADNALGLQISIHLANKGFRVFSGLKDGASDGTSTDSVSSRVIRAWQKHRESSNGILRGSLVALPLDVTREDMLHEAVDIIRAHLPAGEDGLWAVINTSGLSYRGRLDQQDIAHWDAMLKTNVVGLLRTVRAFQGLLRNTSGRIITLGASDTLDIGLVAYTATRYAIEGASNALRKEYSSAGIKVITLNTTGYSPDILFLSPKLRQSQKVDDTSVDITGVLDYQPVLLTSEALHVLDISITASVPKNTYTLCSENSWRKPLQLLKIF